jgi:hypothetical protein
VGIQYEQYQASPTLPLDQGKRKEKEKPYTLFKTKSNDV